MKEPKHDAAKKRGTIARTEITVTGGDIKILKFIHDYRHLRIEQVEALTGRTYTRVHRRLKGLFDAGFLKRIESPQKKDIYHLGRTALPLLLSQGLISEDEARRRSREHELRPATLDHEMMIADLHVNLELISIETPVKLVTWTEGPQIRDAFEVASSPEMVIIHPDAFFQLKDTRLPDGQNRRTFFLEADRSTMPTQPRPGSQRFRDKIERYRWFIECGRPFEKYGVRSIRVVTLVLTRARRDNLCADTEAYLLANNLTSFRKFFMFGCIEDVAPLKPAGGFKPLFRHPGDDRLYPLFPTLAESAKSA